MSTKYTAHMTSFEAKFARWPKGKSIVSDRNDRFDHNHGQFYSPIIYNEGNFELQMDEPDDKWIKTALYSFIRDEFNTKLITNDAPQIYEPKYGVDLLSLARRLRDQTERDLVYSERFHRIAEQRSRFDPIPGVYATICSDDFGQELNRNHITLEQLRQKIGQLRRGCRIMLLGLPFRDQNPARVADDPDTVGMAEAAFLIRLHCTALAIYQSLPTGADILVLSDGNLYSKIFGIEENKAVNYLANVRRLRNELNLQATVSIINLSEVIDIYDNESGKFQSHVDVFSDKIRDWIKKKTDEQFINTFQSLSNGMRWNINTRNFHVKPAILMRWLSDDTLDGAELCGLPTANEVTEIAVKYAAVNLALRWHNAVGKVLPTAVRGTMHPKPEQIGLPKMGSCFPWNGVAVMEGMEKGSLSIEIHSLAEVGRRGIQLIPHCDSKGRVLFYERRR